MSQQCLSLTTADGFIFIQVQVKPERYCVHLASCGDFQLQNVVSASALAFALKEVLENLARLCQASVSQLVHMAGLIALIPPVHAPYKLLHMQVSTMRMQATCAACVQATDRDTMQILVSMCAAIRNHAQ